MLLGSRLPGSLLEQSLILLTLLLINPIQLGITSWYCSLGGGFVPAREALVPLAGSGLPKTVGYGLVHLAALFFAWIIPLLPATVLSGFLKAMFLNGNAQGGSYAMLTVMCFILGFCGVIFAIYLTMGLFFVPFLYGGGKTGNPFRAIAASWRLCNGQRFRLLQVWFCLIPYLLLCLFLAPIPFAAAKMRTILTAFAVTCFDENGL